MPEILGSQSADSSEALRNCIKLCQNADFQWMQPSSPCLSLLTALPFLSHAEALSHSPNDSSQTTGVIHWLPITGQGPDENMAPGRVLRRTEDRSGRRTPSPGTCEVVAISASDLTASRERHARNSTTRDAGWSVMMGEWRKSKQKEEKWLWWLWKQIYSHFVIKLAEVVLVLLKSELMHKHVWWNLICSNNWLRSGNLLVCSS